MSRQNRSTDAPNRYGCKGFRSMVNRRAAIQAGVCGGLSLSLGDMLRLQSQGGDAFSMTRGKTLKDPKALSVIQLHLGGGVPQHESFDPKPESPVEYRGAFGVTKTNTGEVFSENFPTTAAIADKLTVVRSMVGKIPDHATATYHLFTGYTPTAVIDFPQMGSIVSHELGKRGDLPPYVAIPNNHSFAGGTGFLSSTHGPFELNADPAERNYKVKDFSVPEGVSMDRFSRRKTAREIIEQKIRRLEADQTMLDTMDDFYQQAYTLLTSKESQAAFALDGETEETFQLYGRDVVGLRGPDRRFHPKGLAEKMIVARRLVESGVRFVTVTYGAWDSHVDVESACLDQMPALDHAISCLITDLDQRGLLDSTIFWVTSEFGRTPKINNTSGRDHWARNYSMLIAGGGFSRGLIYGASDSIGGEPARDAVPLENLMHTIYHQLGIDASKELLAFGTRPIEIIKGGELVNGLLT
ncbi:MAG: DUF1501 domain-containing protein [Rhodopirellula sp. JB053]